MTTKNIIHDIGVTSHILPFARNGSGTIVQRPCWLSFPISCVQASSLIEIEAYAAA